MTDTPARADAFGAALVLLRDGLLLLRRPHLNDPTRPSPVPEHVADLLHNVPEHLHDGSFPRRSAVPGEDALIEVGLLLPRERPGRPLSDADRELISWTDQALRPWGWSVADLRALADPHDARAPKP